MHGRKVRWIPASLGTALAVLWVACLGLGGCTILLGENKDFHLAGDGGTGGSAPEMACTSSSQCNLGDTCTSGVCNTEGVCSFTTLTDGTACQVMGSTGQCKSGACNKVQCDTASDCPSMACQTATCGSDGACTYTDVSDATPCTLAGSPGSCAAGACVVQCRSASDCSITNPCQTASCDGSTGSCVYQNVPDGVPTPGVTQAVGNCHTHVCVGGMDTSVVNDSNLPPLMSDCEDAQCTSGTPGYSFASHPANSPCSTYMTSEPGFCDGSGHCVQCTTDSECPATAMNDDCQHTSCNQTAGSCATTFTAAGTATTVNPPQVVGNCHTILCDGNGNAVNTIDNTNVPPSGSACVSNHCVNGAPSAPTFNNGVPCGSGAQTCNTQGQCTCTTNANCQPPSYETCGGGGFAGVCGCTPITTCGSLTCGSIPDGCGGTANCNDGKQDGTETDVDCGGVAATGSTCAVKCAQGKKCKVGTDCASGFCADGVCCNTACTGLTCQACSAAAKGQGADGVCGAVAAGATNDPHKDCMMQPASSCGESGGCNGAGACNTYPDGTACSATMCMGMAAQNNPNTCLGGKCTMPAVATTPCLPYACTMNACLTSCGGTAFNDEECTMGYYCDGVGAGTCHAKLGAGAACTNSDECATGQCLGGFCCSGACTGTTGTTCSATCAMTTGACQYPPALTNCGMGTCNGNMVQGLSVCDGEGSCRSIGDYGCPNNDCTPTGCSACGGDGNCTPYGYCSGSKCQPRGGPGAGCKTDDQCVSVHCDQAGNTQCM